MKFAFFDIAINSMQEKGMCLYQVPISSDEDDRLIDVLKG